MNKTYLRILRTRATHFAEFCAALREQLSEREIEPGDSTLVEVAAQLYAIEEDESELYPDDTADEDDDFDDEEDY